MQTTQQTTTPMLAYHGDAAVKRKYLARVRAHAKADEIEKGHYWEHGKGCAVGCTIHGNSHAAYETELGIPESIAHLEDTIFENLPNGTAKEFPARFLKAIKPGADLSLVIARFMVWLLADEADGVIRFCEGHKDAEASVRRVAALYQHIIDGGSISNNEWNAAEVANAAANAAAWAAAEVARAAAEVARAAANAAANAAAYSKMADKLIELLEAA